ncbi:MAG: cysteine--tRNA ligase [Candidatus Nomurabacteria bacterium]|nr:cysteine--tRNA ligase [Candidatus Nomurabacteria bacterium]
MALNLYNSLSRSNEIFKPIEENQVTLYTCGPTVYNYPHIGNYRAYIFGDMLKRTLSYLGYKVKHIMNITDIDDKTIRDSIAQEKTLAEFTEFYTEEFYKDVDSLNIIRAEKYTKATDYIDEMVTMIEALIEKGFAYKSEDGSVYFDIAKDAEYGKLSHFTLSDLKENAKGRMANDEYDKENAQDFALWKSWDENDGEVFWETPLGKGRPGWHIECSAMSTAELGDTIDIHTGGVDNMFPHHENEIAQSECATGHPFVKYWMHNEHLMVDGKKMSKSLGNFYTLRDIDKLGITPQAFRYWLYTGNYDTKVNFTIEAVSGAQTALERLYSAYREVLDTDNGIINTEYKDRFTEVLSDNLNTPKAVAILWELVKDTDISSSDKKATMLDFDRVFGFGLDKVSAEKPIEIPVEVSALADARTAARNEKNWAKSDELRDQIKELGYEIKDVEGGYKITKT